MRQESDEPVFFPLSHFLICCFSQILLNIKIWLLMNKMLSRKAYQLFQAHKSLLNVHRILQFDENVLKNIIKEVAKAHGISEQEVRNEMRVAIRAAMKNTDPTAQAFWKQIAPDGKEPPVERVIASISLMVQENKLCS